MACGPRPFADCEANAPPCSVLTRKYGTKSQKRPSDAPSKPAENPCRSDPSSFLLMANSSIFRVTNTKGSSMMSVKEDTSCLPKMPS